MIALGGRSMSLSFDQHAILELFNLDSSKIEDIQFHNDFGSAIVDVLLRPDYPACPDCGNTKVVIKGYQLKKIKHSLLSDRSCILHYRARRYRCPVCQRTYYEDNPFCFKSQKISALTVHNVLKDLKSHTETFSTVAKRYHISATSAASIFDTHVQESRRILPELMCWDEAYAFHHIDLNSKYVFTILDFISQEPCDILPSRKKEYLHRYFLNIPIEERKKVLMIATDMYAEYRAIIRSIFPKALHSVDHYHVSQELSRKVDSVRIRIMKDVKKTLPDSNIQTDEYYLLKKFNWLIFKRPDSTDKKGRLLFDSNNEKKMNRKLNRYLNFYDIQQLILDIHPDLKAAWQLKDDLVDFYDKNTYETAPEALKDLIRAFASSDIKEMIDFSRTLRNWQYEIINSFIIVKKTHKVDKDTGQVVVSDLKLNNGLMENRNSILKTIKKSSNGYTNWNRFRNRCLYVLRKSSVPSLNPIIPKKRKEKYMK